ncbi:MULTISPECIES: protease inhibitor I9 family protein [Streptomyces]|uniref:Protease inhibitor I9 family protein n=1 Tax=Streptomyces yangpuensis TaxID=1648182 RepID=A0ABY5PWG2_9ACTN|nr:MULTISPECIES: protease inhibitor I9 family protein [Streptomyces]MBZ9596568.1 protease inhibitor I9 family protein [Streptomyces erythrochromogenes]UUY48449.1 protease inhibitor I9 family protein [Streptomyces yangpuensis]
MRILLSRAGRALPLVAAAAALATVTALPAASAALAAPVAAPVTAAATAPVPVARAAAGDEAPYIVTVHKDFDPRAVARMVGASPDYVFRTALHGFSARLTPGQVLALHVLPGVESVQEDGGVSSFDTAG